MSKELIINERHPGVQFTNLKASKRSRDYIDQLAGKVAEKIGYGPGSNIASLVNERLGGEVVKQSFRDIDHEGKICVRAEADFTIHLSPYIGRMRNRFAIAHELGHYFLHSRMGQIPILVNEETDSRAEWEADWFALGLLMPRQQFIEQASTQTDEQLAFYFDVTTDMVSNRKEYLGI